jgi:hypothetical protein
LDVCLNQDLEGLVGFMENGLPRLSPTNPSNPINHGSDLWMNSSMAEQCPVKASVERSSRSSSAAKNEGYVLEIIQTEDP